jgi:prenyltransferase/squalene oxidase-like repeat protein
MDGQRFDRSTQPIGIAPSRRALLAGIAGAALGGLLGVSGEEAAAAPATPTAPRSQKRLAKQSVLKAGLKWIESQQDESGAFAGLGGPDPGTTAVAVITIVALGNAGVTVDTDAAVAYLQQADLSAYSGFPGAQSLVALIVMALVGAGVDPHDVGGVDVVAKLTDSWDAKAGLYGAFAWESAFVIMALTAAGAPIEDKAIATILAQQLPDGSWSANGTTAPGSGNATITAAVVQMLASAGHGDDDQIGKALSYLRSLQADETAAFGEGTFRVTPDSAPDAGTTGTVISALIAVGENPKAKKWGKAVSGLLAYQNESGAFRLNDMQPGDDLASTFAALLALAGAYLLVSPAG